MSARHVAGRGYAWLLRRAVPDLDERDVVDAVETFERVRADALRQSRAAWAATCARELQSLWTTWRDARRRRALAFDDVPFGTGARIAAAAYDARQAGRHLLRDPFFTTIVALTIALGVGANGAAFELLDRLLLRGPEHVEDPGSLVRIYRHLDDRSAGDQTSPWLPYTTLLHLRDAAHAFDSLGAYGVRDTMIGRGENARIRRAGLVLGPFFQTLGTTPQIGRFFTATSDAAGDGPVAVLSDALWRSDFGASPSAIGRPLIADGVSYTIVGVAPPGFSGADFGRVDAWLLGSSRTAPMYNWRIVGRLRPKHTARDASTEIAAIRARTTDDDPKWMGNATLFAAPITFDDTGREPVQARMARWMAGVSLMILVIACANIANLLLVRLARRRRELGIRVALGGGRGRILALVAFEGLLVTALGGVASVWVAGAGVTVGRRALFGDGTGWTSAPIDMRLVALVGAFAAVAAVLIAALPALHAGSGRLENVLRERVDTGPGRSRVRAALTVVQAALSVVLLSGAGLFLRSLSNVDALDLGLQPDRVVVVDLRLDRPPVPADRAKFQEFLTDLRARERDASGRALEAVRRLPGVAHASLTLGMPFDGGSFQTALQVPGGERIAPLPGAGPYISAVTPDYFATMGTRIVRGRAFLPSDRGGSEPVAIVSETSAARLWPHRQALDQCVRIESGSGCHRVVGIAKDVHRVGLREQPSLQVYIPYGQEHGFAGASLILRAATEASLPYAAIRQAILAANPAVPLVDVHLLSESLSGELRPLRLGMTTFGASAVLAALTAAIGLYGLMSYVVAWRRREIGIRLALGATNPQIGRIVIGNGVLLATAGIACGLPLTIVAGRAIEPELFETSASDPLVLVAVSAIVLGIALAAGWLPARRALRISPAEAILAE